MAENSKKKRETWEEREARRLARNVYDHLAYYIQVQLPEKNFVNDSLTLRSRPPGKRNTNRRIRRINRETKETSAGHRSTRRRLADQKKHRHDCEKSSSDSSSERDEKLKSKHKTKHRSGVRSVSSTPTNKSNYSRTPVYSSRPTSSGSKSLHETLQGSPYKTNPNARDIGKSRKAEMMRKEAEMVAAHATNFLKTLPLNEVVAVQKYRSPAKSILRCSSSLSQHPHSMLRSNKAVEYALRNDDRESARSYMREKRRKEKYKALNESEVQREELTSAPSYRRKYKAPATSLSHFDSDSTSSSSEDLETPSSLSRSSSRSSPSTVRRVESSSHTSSPASERRSIRTITRKLSQENPTNSDTSDADLSGSNSKLHNAVSSSGNSSGGENRTSDSKKKKRKRKCSKTSASSSKSKSSSTHETPSVASNSATTSSESSDEGSANFEQDVNDKHSDINGSSKAISESSTVNMSISKNSSSSHEHPTSNGDQETDDQVLSPPEMSPKILSDSQVLEQFFDGLSDSNSTSISAATDGGRKDIRSDGSTEAKTSVSSDKKQHYHRKQSVSLDENHQDGKSSDSSVQKQESDDDSEPENFDASSMTSSLRRLIEETELALSESSSSSDDEESTTMRLAVEERIFGSSLPDVKQVNEPMRGNQSQFETGGEVVGSSNAETEFI